MLLTWCPFFSCCTQNSSPTPTAAYFKIKLYAEGKTLDYLLILCQTFHSFQSFYCVSLLAWAMRHCFLFHFFSIFSFLCFQCPNILYNALLLYQLRLSTKEARYFHSHGGEGDKEGSKFYHGDLFLLKVIKVFIRELYPVT